ncbi:MAG: BRcat domain-containing protein [Oscillospiraceae bacterium]|jgi:predicted RNA-binding Zn-ribbon protein involved in translation (DUF1610 family)
MEKEALRYRGGFKDMIMAGRYGFDELSKLLLIAAAVFFVPSLFLYGKLSGDILRVLALASAFWGLYRAFSRNFEKRSAEYKKYISFKTKLFRRSGKDGTRVLDRRDYKYFKCPGCGVTVRIPKGKGNVSITCPKCSTEFVRRT